MKKYILFLNLWFYLGMLFLTIYSRDIHNNHLVHIQGEKLHMKNFIIQENASIYKLKCYALPVILSNKEELYVVESKEKNKEMRLFAKRINVKLGGEQDGYVPILDGDYFGEIVIVKSDGLIEDGQEIIIE